MVKLRCFIDVPGGFKKIFSIRLVFTFERFVEIVEIDSFHVVTDFHVIQKSLASEM